MLLRLIAWVLYSPIFIYDLSVWEQFWTLLFLLSNVFSWKRFWDNFKSLEVKLSLYKTFLNDIFHAKNFLEILQLTPILTMFLYILTYFGLVEVISAKGTKIQTYNKCVLFSSHEEHAVDRRGHRVAWFHNNHNKTFALIDITIVST